MPKKKLSEMINEQADKTEAILNYVSKNTKNPVACIQLLMAINSMRVACYSIEKQERGGKPVRIIDIEAAFTQARQFFGQLEDYKNKVDE